MFDRFIVATDLSSATFAIVNCLGGLKVYGATHCLLLHCISAQEGASMAYSYQTATPFDAKLDKQKLILEQQGFTVEARTVFGSAKREVNQIATDEDYALIVVGTQGQTLVAERVLGGVAFGIISKAQKPILVLPILKIPDDSDGCEPVAKCGLNDHLLFATDFSDFADHAFSYVEGMVSSGVPTVTLMHVQDQERIHGELKSKLTEFDRIDRDRLQHLERRLKERGAVDVRIEIVYGSPKQEIIRHAEQASPSMIVMGTQGRGFFGEVFMGSVASHVARQSSFPTLLIPSPR